MKIEKSHDGLTVVSGNDGEPVLESGHPVLTFFFFFEFFETEFSCVALAILELALQDHVGLQLRDPSASTSGVLGLKACDTATQHLSQF